MSAQQSNVFPPPDYPPTRVEFNDLARTVADNDEDLTDLKKVQVPAINGRVDSLEHTRTAQLAIMGFVSFLLGVLATFAALWALKP